MSGAFPPEPPRARPLSGGLWSLLAWLRRDGGSSDSLSSAGSDRTVASFAFLAPAHCRHAAPAARAPPSPPTASCRRRERDREQRRARDRDLTLHRKYGLHRDPDADRQDRDRRAFSETLQRRSPHVPGKRRAPPPPGTSATLPSRHSRKRRAPQPPIKFEEKTKENIVEVQNTEMNPQRDGKNVAPVTVSTEYETGKYEKKKATDAKTKQDKHFLKQIFDSKKRRSAIETSSIKILPSISELDKQAAELIEYCRLKEQNNNILNVDKREDPQNSEISKGPRWICITCLRRFDVSVTKCSFCSRTSDQKPNDLKIENKNETVFTQTGIDFRVPPIKNDEDGEREKLKKMLKEMKDSLPKKHKPVDDIVAKKKPVTSAIFFGNGPSETPTLPIGSSSRQHVKISLEEPSTSKNGIENKKYPSGGNTNEIVRKILLQGIATPEEPLTKNITCDSAISFRNLQNNTQVARIDIQNSNNDSEPGEVNKITRINTPLKISSLLNPVYVPKKLDAQASNSPSDTSTKELDTSANNKKVNSERTKIENKTPVIPSTSNVSNINKDKVKVENKISPPVLRLSNRTTVSTQSQTSGANRKSIASNVDEINQHSRRRELINQLEKSIAEGDERAAADAAAKLAQLRLSCSVLSFTSQILGQISNQDITTQKTAGNNGKIIPNPEVKGVSNNISSKVTVVPAASKDTGLPSEGKLEKVIHGSVIRKVDKPEPCCSKSVDKQTKKTDASSSQQDAPVNGSYMVSISVWIEDKNAAHGPIKLEVRRSDTLGELRARAATRLGVSRALQRWIVGRTFCVDDAAPLVALAGPDLDAPFYLCLVEANAKQIPIFTIKDGSQTKNGERNEISRSDNEKTGAVYTELIQLERQAIVPNSEAFECPVCMEECPAGRGAVLRECAHAFCRSCLGEMVRHGAEPELPCPAVGCRGALQQREVRALVSRGEYERWLARGLAAAESGTRDSFHCRTRDCTGWALCEAGVTKFPCPVCKRNNCVPCQAIHEGETCEQYRSKLQEASGKVTNQTDEGTKALLDSLISRGEALECPECSAIITKKWGCDWVKCSACKTEICWVTRGRRWGPAGRGDTSAGCRCGVDGKRCHPSCGYCH